MLPFKLCFHFGAPPNPEKRSTFTRKLFLSLVLEVFEFVCVFLFWNYFCFADPEKFQRSSKPAFLLLPPPFGPSRDQSPPVP